MITASGAFNRRVSDEGEDVFAKAEPDRFLCFRWASFSVSRRNLWNSGRVSHDGAKPKKGSCWIWSTLGHLFVHHIAAGSVGDRAEIGSIAKDT